MQPAVMSQFIPTGHITALPLMQAPPWQVSMSVQALPSVHPAPSDFAGFEQTPPLQVPASWHWSCAMQTIGFPPTQLPPWQVSVRVQALPSLQPVPLFFCGFEHVPLAGLQVPTSWHWSCAVHVTGLAPVHAPPWQVSVWVQALPSVHVSPSGLVGLEQTPVVGLHIPATWH